MATKPIKIGFTQADGRPLSRADSWYFDNCFFPLAISFAVPSRPFGDDQKLRDSFYHCIKTSPILQTMVTGEGPTAVFRQLPSEADWPALKIFPADDDDGMAYKKIVSVLRDTVALIVATGTEAHRQSVRMFAVRGKNSLAVALICPHHFLDGMGIGILIAKFFLYARLPRWLWPTLDRRMLKDSSVPTFLEMTLKDQYHQLKEVDGTLSPMMDPNNFRFADYDFTESKLRGFEYGEIATVRSPRTMQKCRSNLRKAGVSISTAFGGLAVKTLALLIKHAELPEDTANQPLLPSIAIDARGLGKWGDSRDSKLRVPVVGNYAYGHFVQVPQETARNNSVEHLATILKKGLDRHRTDVDFRLHAIANIGVRNLATSDMFCGVSSMVIPPVSRLAGIPLPTRLDTKIDFGPVPRVWFYIVTIGSHTSICADIQLPIATLTPELVRQTILSAARGSALEPLLS